MHAGEEDHAWPDRQHEDVDRTPRGRVNQNNRGQITEKVRGHGVANPRIEDG